MRVLVTGGLGFIGHHVSRALIERGDEVTILDARTAPVHDPAEPREAPEGSRLIEAALDDRRSIDEALRAVDAVIHLAAYQDYQPDVHRFFHVNVTGTALLLERAAEVAPDLHTFVFASSQSVYGEGAVRCPEHSVVVAQPRRIEDLAKGELEPRCPICSRVALPEPTPEGLTAPANPYGLSKLSAERLLFTLGPTRAIRCVALRYAIVHGAWQSPRNAYSGVLRAAVVRALEGQPPIVFEDGASLRDYVAIEDVVSATLLALDQPAISGPFNVGGPRSWTVLELLEGVSEATGLELQPEIPGWFRVGDVRHTIGDLSALGRHGWTPEADLRSTWQTYVSWLKEHMPPPGTVDRALESMRRTGVLREMSRSDMVRGGSS